MTLPTPSQGPSSSLPACPFVAGPMIRDPRFFVGRKDLLQAITSRMIGAQPTSINLVGEPRIGKSSLLYHFFQTWEQRVPDVNRYVVMYLSLQEADCRNKQGLYQAIARELLSRPFVRRKRSLADSLKDVADDSAFARALAVWKENKILPVLCLDEFEVLPKYRTEFDDGFFDHLRSLMDKNALMLILASHKPIDVYRKKYSLTSKFFNQAHVLYLKILPKEEADDLVRLPASTTPGLTPALIVEDQQLARKWAGTHPYLLQLAAYFLWHARQEGKDVIQAKKQYEVEQRRLYEPASPVPNVWPPLWSLCVRIGRLHQYVSKNSDEIKKGITGFVILVAGLVLLGLGLAQIPQLLAWLLKFLSFGG